MGSIKILTLYVVRGKASLTLWKIYELSTTLAASELLLL